MPKFPTRFLSPLAAAALAAGLYAQMRPYYGQDAATQQHIEQFHTAVRQAVAQIPMRITVGGDDFEGFDIPIPAAAGTLLHPNAIFSRRYMDASKRWVQLVLVHCRDSRDMSGHYPPNCYPGSGWTLREPEEHHVIKLWGRQVPVAEYNFTTRTAMDRKLDWAVYDFFVLPAGGMCTSMGDVRRAGGDYRTRPYGAAQIQVVLDAGMRPQERTELLRAVLAPLGPVIDRLQFQKHQGDS
jgi:hypothetical protein